MTGRLYCSKADLYEFGLPRGSIPNPARLIASAPIGGHFSLDQHGLSIGQPVSFRTELGGALPAPIVALTTYYAIPVDQDRFDVATAAGGSTITLTSAADLALLIIELPEESAIEFASRALDEMLPAHVVPLADPVPFIVKATTAELAAAKLGQFSGSSSASLMGAVDAAWKRIERWAKGVPVRGPLAPATNTNLAASGATAARRDARGWRRFGGI